MKMCLLWLLTVGFIGGCCLAKIEKTILARGPSVIVEAPPAVLLSNRVYMVRKQDLELRCSVLKNINYNDAQEDYRKSSNNNNNNNDELAQKLYYSQPPTAIVWTKDGSPIAGKLKDGEDFLIMAHRLLLKPHKDPERFEGDYSCTVTWLNAGSIISPSISVHLAGFQTARLEHSSNIVYAIPNNTVFIPCSVPDSKPKAIISRFSKDNITDVLSSELNFYISETGMQIAPNDFTLEAQGYYTCSVRNPITGQIKESHPVQLIFDNSTRTYMPIRVLVPEQKNTKLEVNVGENVILECVMIGVPAPVVAWEKYGGYLPISRSKQNLGNLHISNVSKSDEGTYLCKAIDPSGSEGVTKTYQQRPVIVYEIIVKEPVKALLRIEQSKDYDKAWHLNCESVGGRAIDLLPYFNGQLLPTKGVEPLHYRFDAGDGPDANPKWSLSLKSPLTNGFYQCLVRSPGGDLTYSDNWLVTSDLNLSEDVDQMSTSGMEDSDFYMTTFDPFLPQIIEGPENTTILENLPVTMVCKVLKVNNVVWLKDGSTLKFGDRFNLLGSASLEIRTTTQADKGWYTCLAANARGNASASAYLNVENPSALSAGYEVINSDNHYIDQDDAEYADDDKLLISDTSGEIKIVTTITPPKNAHHKRKKLKIHLDAPEVYRMSNTSVLLNWKLPPKDTLPGAPQIFKVQYKKVKSNNKWITLDLDLPEYSRSHSVDGLEPEGKYKFRIGVVFENDLQAVSRASRKYTLSAEPESLPPQYAPEIVRSLPISPSAIQIVWEHPVAETASLEGFVINYRRIYAGAPLNMASYQNETVIGGDNREHALTHLLPATPYEIKIAAFNSYGRSQISEPKIASTMTADGTIPSLSFLPSEITTESNRKNTSLSNNKNSPSSTGDGQSTILGLNQETFLLILGALLGAVLIITVIFMILCLMKQRKKEKAVLSTSNGKFRDASKRIYREQSLCSEKTKELYSPTLNKTLLKNNNLPPPPSVTGYATNGHVVNLYSNPLDSAVDDGGPPDYNDISDELTCSVAETGFANNKNGAYKNYLDVSVSGRSNSTSSSSHRSDRSKTNNSGGGAGSNTTDFLPIIANSRSPMLATSSGSNTCTPANSQYLWAGGGSSPRPAERRSWNFSSSPPSSIIDHVVDSRTNSDAQDSSNSRQFFTFKPERSPHHSNNGNLHRHHHHVMPPTVRPAAAADFKKPRHSDGYHSDA